MDKPMLEEVAENLGVEVEMVCGVVAEFALQLHRRALEYRGLNGDFIGEKLWSEINGQAFYHLLGFLTYFADRYGWDEQSASEYLLRLGTRAEWAPFLHQMAGWQVTDSPSRDISPEEVPPIPAESTATCPVCDSSEFNHNELPTVREFYDSNHEWVLLKACSGCGRAFFVYGVELCRLSSSGGEDDIYTYAVPVSQEEVSDLETLDWRRDMLSWENNSAKRLILSRRRHVFNASGSFYWSETDTEVGLCVIPPG